MPPFSDAVNIFNLVLQPSPIGTTQFQQPLFLQILRDIFYSFLDTLLVTPDSNFGIFGFLIRRADPRELRNFALSGLFIETLGVTGLGNFERDVDKDFDEAERFVIWKCSVGGSVKIACDLPICSVRRDERCYGNSGRVREQFGDLCKLLIRNLFQSHWSVE